MSVKNILFVGVGGQGSILASKLMTTGLVESGYDVKMSEIHGMAQRGGSVSTQVRFGKKVYSPVIEDGTADIVVAFEKMEAYRWIEKLKPMGKLIVNDFEIPSALILAGLYDYPEHILETLKALDVDLTVINAAALAEEIGSGKVMNVVLLGAVVKALQLKDIQWETVITSQIKPQFVELNLQAFKLGYDRG
jgi:indolepyruvate ferredoxin oxidoreductase beta subunit